MAEKLTKKKGAFGFDFSMVLLWWRERHGDGVAVGVEIVMPFYVVGLVLLVYSTVWAFEHLNIYTFDIWARHELS